MKGRYLFYVAIFIGIVLILIPRQYLILESDNGIQTIQPVSDKESFSIQWRHSVEKEIWEEFFKIKKKELFIDQTRFKTFGAGVPSHAGSDTYIKDGWVYMVGIDRKIGKELRIRTGKSTEYQLNHNGMETKMDESGTAYTIRVERMTFIQASYQNLSK